MKLFGAVQKSEQTLLNIGPLGFDDTEKYRVAVTAGVRDHMVSQDPFLLCSDPQYRVAGFFIEGIKWLFYLIYH